MAACALPSWKRPVPWTGRSIRAFIAPAPRGASRSPSAASPDGQGIRLTLVQEVLTNHRFRFALESDPEPTRFTIRF
jgi:hypothetical protein